MKKKIVLIITTVLLSSILLNSCRKKGCTDEDATNYEKKAKKDDGSCDFSTQSSDDHNEAQKEFDDIQSILDDALNKFNEDMDKSAEFLLSDTTCAILSVDTAYSEGGAKGRVIIDFGSTNCEGNDGRNRRGKIYIAYTGKHRSIGTIITTTFDNYFVNDNQIEGTRIVETVSREVYNVQVRDAKITFTDATTINWETDVTRTWTEGNEETLIDIFNIWNDVYDVSGTASGTGRYGLNFTVDITSVTLKLECWLSGVFHPVSGSITVKPSGFANRVIDFGDGTCDKKGTITIGDNEPIEYDLAQ